MLYYQPQPPAYYNQHRQYRHHITKQQYPYRTDYDKEKQDKHGLAYIVIPSPDIKQLPIITLVNVPNYSEKIPIVYSCTSLNTETRNMPQLNTQPKLQTKNNQ